METAAFRGRREGEWRVIRQREDVESLENEGGCLRPLHRMSAGTQVVWEPNGQAAPSGD